jgi:hypothetical protein
LVKIRPEKGFRGVLRRVGLQDVIQMECLARSSSVLEIFNARSAGKVFIDTGQIVHAQTESAVGEAAFNQLMSLGGGHFNLRPFSEPATRSISGQWEFLLMEAARKSDESREPGDEPPLSGESSMTPAEAAASPPTATVPAPDVAASSCPPGPVPVLPASVPSRPKVDEMLICSAHGEVLYQWQCHNPAMWLNFFEFVSQRGARLAQSFPLGEFNRLEVESGGARAVVIISSERGVLVKSRREALNP